MKKGLAELLTAWRMYQKLRDEEGTSYTCCALGGIYRMLGRYAESGRWYREANRRMRKRKDTFGIAYSYCGLGNAHRMAGRFHQALPFYRKAEKLYGTIGDKVSYAYTLWSMGTTFKMLGQYAKAAQNFLMADKLFIQTGDTRGRIYISQGISELRSLILKSRDPKTKLHKTLWNYHNDKRNQVESESFKWEKKNENALLFFAIGELALAFTEKHQNKGKEIQEAKKKLSQFIKRGTKEIKSIYQKAGSKFYPKSIPVNWP
jgi:tetratricopeptide (TPR) repeat protein